MDDLLNNIGSYIPKDVSVFSYAEPYGRTPAPSSKYKDRKAAQRASFLKKKAIKEALEKGHKLCTSCNQELSLFNFDIDKKTFTGYSSMCKECKKQYNQRYRKGNINDNETQ